MFALKAFKFVFCPAHSSTGCKSLLARNVENLLKNELPVKCFQGVLRLLYSAF